MRRSLWLVWVLARGGVRRSLRGRLLLFVVAVVLATLALGAVFRRFEWNRALEMRLVLEAGMTLSGAFVLGSALFLGARGLASFEDATPYHAILALPLPRWVVVAGQLTGMLVGLALHVLILGAALMTLVWVRFGTWEVGLALHFGTVLVEAAVLLALATFLSTLGSSRFAFLAGAGVAALAHAEPLVRHLVASSGSTALAGPSLVLIRLLPAVGGMDLRTAVVRGQDLPLAEVSMAALHCLAYGAVVTGLACWRLQDREL